MKRVCALAALGVGCAIAGVSFASGGSEHGLKPPALAFMRKVALPPSDVPPAVRRAFAAHPRAGQPRLAAAIPARGGRLALWVAPLRGRGWCEGLQWPRTRFRGINCTWWRPTFGPFAGIYAGPAIFEGRAAVTSGRELRLLFADGSSLRIPTRDGFYLYRVPDERLIRTPPRALLLRGQARTLAVSPLVDPFFDRPTVAGGKRPAWVDARRTRTLLTAATKAGIVRLLSTASRFVPATCWWLRLRHGTYGSGCVRDGRDTSSMWIVAPQRLAVHGHEVWVLWGRAGSTFPSLQLRYQGGRRAPISRRGDFFLHVVRGPERVSGHRPASLVAVGPSGRVLRKELLLAFAWAR